MRAAEKIRGLYAIIDTRFSPQLSHRELAELILQGGCKILQLRMKGEKDLGKVRKAARSILELKERQDFTFILNDYADLAAELPVDGLHLGQDDGPISEARRKLGPGKLIGYSSHSLEEALHAEAAGADYVALGAIFPTKTKGPGHPVQGLDTLEGVARALKVPLVAIGGIHRGNIQGVVEAGAACIAVITALSQAEDIPAAARELASFFPS